MRALPPPPDLEVVILNDYAAANGGSSAVAIASALGLAARGLRVTLFTCVGPVAPGLSKVPNLEVVCLGQHEIAKDPDRLRALASGLRNPSAISSLRALLAGKDPDRTIVHAHTWMKALSPFALEVAPALGFPLVVTLHDFFITCPNGGFYDHAAGAVCRRKPLSLSCVACDCDRRHYAHKLWRVARTALQNLALRLPSRVSAYLAVSEFSLDILRPHLPPGVPAAVLRNPVDSVDRGPADVARNRAFVYVGRFVPEKGVHLFAEAVRRTGLPAVFIGDGELSADLRRLCPDARFTGWLPPERIAAELRSARALVFPPTWYETLGLVAVEAAAAGLPVVVSDGCAASGVIRHGQTGLHFVHGSVDSLARRMGDLAANDDLSARLGRAAHEWYWSDPWTAERHVDDLLDHYERVLSNAPAGARAPVCS
jgi:glycosyltransferase involved in cell wall biosynthesis